MLVCGQVNWRELLWIFCIHPVHRHLTRRQTWRRACYLASDSLIWPPFQKNSVYPPDFATHSRDYIASAFRCQKLTGRESLRVHLVIQSWLWPPLPPKMWTRALEHLIQEAQICILIPRPTFVIIQPAMIDLEPDIWKAWDRDNSVCSRETPQREL